MDAHLLTDEPRHDLLRDAESVYAAAFTQPPYGEGPHEVAAFREKLGRYARDRDGFRLVVINDDGPAGVGLAVLARPGDWWRDRASEAIDPALAEEWLGTECLEIVHIAVHPRAQGRGLGRLVHDLLIAGTPAPTAILSLRPGVEPARRLYASRGWQLLTDRLPAGGGTANLMGRRL